MAPLAGVTTDYTRLEQGRHPNLSKAVLASVPHALRQSWPPSPTPFVSTTNAAASSPSPAPRPTAP
ncbi:hypothetical protein [Streptomyces sviceus]|uniref:hypothetical protein n=1 Tax=Streptomyces sviceus TaxID=285530 RepID=UPI0036C5FD6A